MLKCTRCCNNDLYLEAVSRKYTKKVVLGRIILLPYLYLETLIPSPIQLPFPYQLFQLITEIYFRVNSLIPAGRLLPAGTRTQEIYPKIQSGASATLILPILIKHNSNQPRRCSGLCIPKL